MSAQGQRDRLLDLLCDQATGDLAPAERLELDRLLQEHTGIDPESMERAAAALDLALGGDDEEPMPASLESRIQAQALTWMRGEGDSEGTAPQGADVVDFERPRSDTPRRTAGWVGWVAAAALLVVAVLGWLGRPAGETPLAPPALKQALLREAPDAVVLDWSATEDPAARNASGEVVWSSARDEGYMTFRGLQPNDPSEFQYQLWIFDAQRDERYPVDGGVFDVPPSASAPGEVVVPIRAKLPVHDVALFAVTVEKPGGVVVSERERIVVLAKMPEETG